MSEIKIEAKKVKSFQGMEGLGYNADIYVNDVKTLFVMDGGDGGMVSTRIYNDEQYKLLKEHIESLPETEIFGKMYQMDEELFFGSLIDEYMNKKAMMKYIKTGKTVYMKKDKAEEYFISDTPYSEEYAEWLRKNVGDDVVIFNEKYA